MTEDETSSAVLQRVNTAVSVVNWENESRTQAVHRVRNPPQRACLLHPVCVDTNAGSRTLASLRTCVDNCSDYQDDNRQTLTDKVLAIERETVFNTPLPRGARSAMRKRPQEV